MRDLQPRQSVRHRFRGPRAMTDRATVAARDLLQIVARYILDGPDGGVALHVRFAERLRDEFDDVARETLNEIRREDG